MDHLLETSIRGAMYPERRIEQSADGDGDLPFEYRPDIGAVSNFFRMLN